MKSPKIRKTIFRLAASLIAREHFNFSCIALKYSGANQTEMDFYSGFFKPEIQFASDPWWETTEFDRNCRIFALLLAAEMAE